MIFSVKTGRCFLITTGNCGKQHANIIKPINLSDWPPDHTFHAHNTHKPKSNNSSDVKDSSKLIQETHIRTSGPLHVRVTSQPPPPYYLQRGEKRKVALVGLQAAKLVLFAGVCVGGSFDLISKAYNLNNKHRIWKESSFHSGPTHITTNRIL